MSQPIFLSDYHLVIKTGTNIWDKFNLSHLFFCPNSFSLISFQASHSFLPRNSMFFAP